MREMRRKDRQLDMDGTVQVVRDGIYGVMATVCEDGTPYSVPLNYVYDEAENVIYIHCSNVAGQKLDNIRSCNSVCFTIVSQAEVFPEELTTLFHSANIIGTVEMIEGDSEKRHALKLIVEKYAPDFMEKGMEHIDGSIDRTGILKINISQITGKARLSKHERI